MALANVQLQGSIILDCCVDIVISYSIHTYVKNKCFNDEALKTVTCHMLSLELLRFQNCIRPTSLKELKTYFVLKSTKLNNHTIHNNTPALQKCRKQDIGLHLVWNFSPCVKCSNGNPYSVGTNTCLMECWWVYPYAIKPLYPISLVLPRDNQNKLRKWRRYPILTGYTND